MKTGKRMKMEQRLYVVGIGPGGYEKMTIEAASVLKECEIIVGYTVYVELIRDHFPGKEWLTTPMRREEERCRMAFELAQKGKKTALICSGDAGVYGMAGLVLELNPDYPDVKVNVIPGVTAALSGAALLGAALMHDFAVISLSDLLTPWETIEKRLRAAAEADLVICLYNPSSKKRADYLKKACAIIRAAASPDTVCAYVKQIGREGERKEDHDPAGIGRMSGGYVYHGVHRQLPDQADRGCHGDAAGISDRREGCQQVKERKHEADLVVCGDDGGEAGRGILCGARDLCAGPVSPQSMENTFCRSPGRWKCIGGEWMRMPCWP